MDDDRPGATLDAPTIQQYRSAYNQANRLAKEVEIFRAAAVIPVHNELRNAGDHLIRSLGDDGQVYNTKELAKAIGHCERAMYEASEAGIFLARRIIIDFKENYDALTIEAHIDDWEGILQTTYAADDILAAGRSEREPTETAAAYMEHFRRMAAACRTIGMKEGTVAAVAARERRRFIWNFAAPVAVILGALIVATSNTFREELRIWITGC